jgi:hypothetical protein
MDYFESIHNATTGEVTTRYYTESEIAEMRAAASPVTESIARSHRNILIAETDWWATSDRTMSAEQTAYRQALRDITSQAGFPTDITWPTKPE